MPFLLNHHLKIQARQNMSWWRLMVYHNITTFCLKITMFNRNKKILNLPLFFCNNLCHFWSNRSVAFSFSPEQILRYSLRLATSASQQFNKLIGLLGIWCLWITYNFKDTIFSFADKLLHPLLLYGVRQYLTNISNNENVW